MSTKTLVRLALPLLTCGVCLTGTVQAAPGGKTLLNGSSPKWATTQNFLTLLGQ